MAEIRAVLADNIKRLRQLRGITQAELAERASITSNYIGMIEQKRKFPTPEILDKLAAALHIEPPELFSAYIPPAPAQEKLYKALLEAINKVFKEIPL
jgi:transcriptional regulator with XRE-family HTH domain